MASLKFRSVFSPSSGIAFGGTPIHAQGSLSITASGALKEKTPIHAQGSLSITASGALTGTLASIPLRIAGRITLAARNPELRFLLPLSVKGLIAAWGHATIQVTALSRTDKRTALLHNLPGFFDRDPEPVLALRVESPQGFQGQVSQGVLTWQDGQQGAVQAISLQGLTLAQLAQRLTAYNGLTVPFLSAEYRDCPAMRLVPDIAYRDGFYVSTSILWAHLQALGQAIGAAESALAAMLRQLVIPQAREEWADAWGFRLGMPRQTGESDADYTQRMIDELYRWRSNPVAMRNNVKRYTGADIELFEPWTRMWTLSQSTLSGGADHFPSGDYYAYHWLHPVARRPGVNWEQVLPVLQADRPAGTLLIDPAYYPAPIWIDGGYAGRTLDSAAHHVHTQQARAMDCGILDDNLWLSAHCVTRNYQAGIFGWHTRSLVALASEIAPIGKRRTFCIGETLLSDAQSLGGFQSHFPGRAWIEVGAPLRLSENSLSDYQNGGYWQAIDEWLSQNHGSHGSNEWPPADISVIRTDTRSENIQCDPISIASSRVDTLTSDVQINKDRTWQSGEWDETAWDAQPPAAWVQTKITAYWS